MDDEPIFWFVDGEAFEGIAPSFDCFEALSIVNCFALDSKSIGVLVYRLDSWFIASNCRLFDSALKRLD